ncbi:chemotaxis protein CheD [Methylomonas rivi]|uniref:Probable chemoreceptor glutamine deamidase CheD n=1 Tax=Methylomonas rivi TaxID=2952226 RepID=A0ABT1U5L3_9GAMM|nr:chemotaxis protein CheD [Methylomonas sp. WSC-6]MCQ8129143.1 chemotaxis protein CheD [Methylomonas sp. WSC-6]
MTEPENCIDIFLQPGEFYFGDRQTRIRTLLGSCVAITLWHPRRKIGGMCHYLLPMCKGRDCGKTLDGRYAHDAMKLFVGELHKAGGKPHDFEAKMFGGGNQFPGKSQVCPIDVSAQNVKSGRELLGLYGFNIKAEHLGGTGHRNVIFDVWSGEVWLKHVAKPGEH